MQVFTSEKNIFEYLVWYYALLVLKIFHLGKDSGKDKFSKGREEEKSPVETKDVDHLDENLPNKIHQI